MIAEAIYIVCVATSLLCAALLFRAYRQNRSRLLLWSTLCFVGLAINNALVVLDLVFLPQIDLRVLRTAVNFVSVFGLLASLLWEAR